MNHPILKLSEPDINLHAPLIDDLLNRWHLAKRLTEIITGQEQTLRIALHGPWGTGKTFLLRRWAQQLRNDDFRAIYFSAWEEDFRRDPIVSILGQLYRELEGERTFQNALKQISDTTRKVLLAASNEALRVTTGTDASNIVEVIKSANPLEAYSEEGKTRDELRQRLLALANSVKDQTKHPLVFIIDELDRCRPTWAVECLEHIKHLLEIQNIIFVFGINRNELCKSIKHANGDIDASTYLQRFFDIELNMPEINHGKFFQEMLDNHRITQKHQETETGTTQGKNIRNDLQAKLTENISTLMEAMNPSLREIESCARTIALAVRTNKSGLTRDSELLAILAIIKAKSSEMYLRITQGKCPTRETISYLENVIGEKASERKVNDLLIGIEISLMAATQRTTPERQQIEELERGQKPSNPELLSERLREAIKVKETMERQEMVDSRIATSDIATLNELIDLYPFPT